MTIRGPLAIVLVVVPALSLAANFIVAGFAAARLSVPAYRAAAATTSAADDRQAACEQQSRRASDHHLRFPVG